MDPNQMRLAAGLTGQSEARLNQLAGNNEAGGKKGGAPPPDYRGAMEAQGPRINWQTDFGQLGDGQAAADAVYKQATSRLDPMWARREDQAHTRLLNQGLDPQSEAYKSAMSDLGQERNDAYGSAFAQSFGQGQELFKTNMMARQQAIAEAIRRRMQPLDELGAQQQLWSAQGEIDAANNPLNGIGDLLSGALNIGKSAKGLFGF